MRPIDDLREKIDLWKKSTTDTALMSVLNDVLKQIDVAIYEMDHQEDESTLHKVEEPPKEDGWYILGFLSRWRDGNWWIPEFPDYWMAAGAPKED